MTMTKIELKKAYDEFEIGDKTYKLFYTDEKIKAWAKEFEKVGNEAGELNEEEENIDASRDLAIKFFDLLFEENAGQEIYKECGESTYVLMDVFTQIYPVMNEKVDELKLMESKKYTG